MLLIPILGGVVISVMSMIVLVVMWLFMRKDLEQKAAATHNGPDERPSPSPTPAATLPRPGPPPRAKPAADNLRKIKGIGPKTAGVLQAAGITTFAALADTAVERLQAILDEAGVAKSVKPATWPEQARQYIGH